MSPIRPENRGRYPDDWPAISARIRHDRAGDRCECDGRCGTVHDGDDGWANASADTRCRARNRQPHPRTGSNVVLTVAHLDHTPENCDDENLMAMCQRCHLAYDRHLHTANARRTRDERRGQPSLLDGDA